MASVAAAIQSQIHSGRSSYSGAPAGMTSSVRPFSGADASTGSLLVKLGTKAWEAVKSKAVERDNARRQQLEEALVMAHIQNLLQPKGGSRATAAATVNGQRIEGLTPYEAAKLAQQESKPKPADKNPRSAVDIGEPGHPVPANLTASELLRFMHDRQMADQFTEAEKGRNTRAGAARALADKLAGIRQADSKKSKETLQSALNAARALGAIPETLDEQGVNAAAYGAADDSIGTLTKSGAWGVPKREELAAKLLPKIRAQMQARLDSTRAPHLKIITDAEHSLTGSALSPEAADVASQLRDLLNRPE
jgi:hypothetical protein